MQTLRSAPVRLLMWTLVFFVIPKQFAFAATTPAKVHVVALGAVRKVAYTLPERSAPTGGTPEATELKVRPLTVDGRQKEWTTGEPHDVTDRSFAIRRALRLNDALPGNTRCICRTSILRFQM
jgi:hypothetical protein